MAANKAAEVKKLNRKLMDFLDSSVNAFFAVENMKNILLEEGFLPLYEGEDWNLKKGGKYLSQETVPHSSPLCFPRSLSRAFR